MGTTLSQPKAVAPAAFEKELTQLDQGVLLELPGNVSLTINGVSVNAAAIDTTLQSWITVFKAVDSAKASYKNAVSARVAITTAAKAYVKALKAVVKAYFGPQGTQLASFGIATDQPVERTAQQKLVSAAKAKQTRAVRGTTSKKQKAALTVVGNPPVLVPSTGPQGIAPPPVNVSPIGSTDTTGFSTTSSTAGTSSSSAPASPSSTPASAPTPAPAGSGSGSGTPTSGSGTPAA